MAVLFQKFQKFVGTLAKSPTFAKDPRRLQFETDINRLFLYTSYNRVGKDAEEADIEEIINMASKSDLADQEKQVQENIHSQITNFCTFMDHILLPESKSDDESSQQHTTPPRRSGLSLAIGRNAPPNTQVDIPETKPLTFAESRQRLKELMGYTLELKPSQIPHEQAGRGLFVDGEADVGSVIALYPGVIYSPAYYRYIPGYPRVDARNPYLITRYDGTVINGQPWGTGGETREAWTQSSVYRPHPSEARSETGSDRVWKMLSKPLEASRVGFTGEVLERRNPLALAHFANHPAKGTEPNVMVCPYDFPLNEKGIRAYIPNVVFGGVEEVKMKRFGSFWFKSRGESNDGQQTGPVMKSVALVATRLIRDEEVYLNYRLSNSKRRPSWYTPVDEEEDRRRWS
ncbi:putative SET domain-containing protein [Helianthus annuus]|uniref:SET domain-containing protein n=1 Tax=Helianthus annuus TaxID=4232 RepID=A0A251T4R2_HELAN|nr:uncharacterized protein LOC110895540 [Helianthus annuus]KAF5779484.1 putative SET domain-containing protein [Helianthus annuus]KAJ0490735.1 putative SET domain-containing protein [Helianthus annuus]KAJ0506656.1 putative SET domain-containing protein [Helianthus annuus]KAJ0676331.1 putative SET domain-containing protein [Helianthus annuus]KAJ0868140.1 putative SET domain-containing protein [Helianthus annuus]